LFFGDAFDGHGAILAVPSADVKAGLRPAPLRLGLGLGSQRHHDRLVYTDIPSIRPFAAVIAAEVDGVGFARDGEIVAARQIAAQPVPHICPSVSTEQPLLSQVECRPRECAALRDAARDLLNKIA
jgi:hypothetical protein